MASDETRTQGWYPDDSTGGTRFWDGRQWSGDVRPIRQSYAAPYRSRAWGLPLTIIGTVALLGSPAQLSAERPEGATSGAVVFWWSIAVGIVCLSIGIYFLRGRGPSTRSVLTRWEHEQAERARLDAAQRAADEVEARALQDADARTAQLADTRSRAVAAQIEALSDPDTAKALKALQDLLYTRTITEEEFRKAKDRLLGDLTS